MQTPFAKRRPHDESSVPYLGVRILAPRWNARLHCARAEPYDHRTAKTSQFPISIASSTQASLSRPLHGLTSIKHKRTNELRSATRRISRAAVRFRLFNISRTAHHFSPNSPSSKLHPVVVHRTRLHHLRVLRTLTINESLENPLSQACAAHKRRENRRLLPARKRASPESRKRPRRQNMPTTVLAHPWKPRAILFVHPYPSNGRIFSFGRPAQS